MPGDEVDRSGQEDWAGELQRQVDEDMAKVYSPRVLDLWQNPQNAGSLDYPDGYGQITGPCGDTMQVWIRVRDGTITEARFWTDGCGTSIVCGSVVTIMARGRTLDEAHAIDQEKVLAELGGLPEEDAHCALLASETLRQAIARFCRMLVPVPAGERARTMETPRDDRLRQNAASQSRFG